MSESQNDSKNSSRKSSDAGKAERAVRSSNISLAEQRRSGRTLGFLGLSTFGHVAILVALASIPAAVHEIGGADNKPAGAGEVSMVESSAPTSTAPAVTTVAESSSVEVSVMTDETSDITQGPAIKPQPKPEPEMEAAVVPLPEKKTPAEKPKLVAKKSAKLPAKAPVKLKAAPVQEVAATSPPTMTEPSEEAPPVLLANPPSDDGQDAEPIPAVAAATEEAQQPENTPQKSPEQADQRVTETIVEQKAAVVLVQKESEPIEEEATEAADEPAIVAAASPSESTAEAEPQSTKTAAASSAVNDAASGDDSAHGRERQGETENGLGGAVAGPVRDASELKALSGNPNPVYPARDRLARKEGTAIILGRVSPDGRVVEATLEKSSGSSNMDSASLRAFRGWRFQAGQQGWVRKPFQFRLVGAAKEVPAPLGKGLKR